MAKNFDISMLGDKELAKRFAEAPRKLQRRLLVSSMKEAAEPIAQSASQKAPVDTGKLAASIHVTKAKATRGAGVKVSIATGSRDDLGIAADAKGFYPMSVEVGYVHAGGKHIPAQPYLRPALAENKEKVLSSIKSDLASGLQEIAGGA